MATQYKLTWRTDQNGRWRKKYKGKSYYFQRLKGETKEASYQRCWKEWLKKKSEIDQQIIVPPWVKGLQNVIAKTRTEQSELQKQDTPQNRHLWSLDRDAINYCQSLIADGVNPFLPEDNMDDPPMFLGGNAGVDVVAEPPPWVQAERTADPENSLDGNVKRFLQRKEAQANRGERSIGRYDSLRVGLESFCLHCGGHQPIQIVNTAILSRYRDELERLVETGKLRPHTARDRLQVVKQFVRWAWEEELIGLPRILESREFTIAIPEAKIETFTDKEVQTLLAASSETTKLYLLLMLNCGMQQQDISDLLQSEVDWNAGRITRKRSKTRKNGNGKNVPSVSYPLWPETLRLIRKYRSKHPERALANQKGMPLKFETIQAGQAKKIDNIRSAFNRVIHKLANSKTDPVEIKKPLKLFRKTAATKLGGHPEHSRFAQYFLGHAPATVADKHYVAPSEAQFDAAVAWLGTQFSDAK